MQHLSLESSFNAGDPRLTPGLGRFPGEGNGNPLRYYCLDNSTDRGAWWAPLGIQSTGLQGVGQDSAANIFILHLSTFM